MKNIGIVILVIGSLLGLGFIQYHLLKVGILLNHFMKEYSVELLMKMSIYQVLMKYYVHQVL